jgi:hypothetical protein
MSLTILQDFFLWGLVLSVVIFMVQFLLILSIKDFIAKMHAKLFNLDTKTINKIIYLYFGIYKIAIIVLFLVPWLVLKII